MKQCVVLNACASLDKNNMAISFFSRKHSFRCSNIIFVLKGV